MRPRPPPHPALRPPGRSRCSASHLRMPSGVCGVSVHSIVVVARCALRSDARAAASAGPAGLMEIEGFGTDALLDRSGRQSVPAAHRHGRRVGPSLPTGGPGPTGGSRAPHRRHHDTTHRDSRLRPRRRRRSATSAGSWRRPRPGCHRAGRRHREPRCRCRRSAGGSSEASACVRCFTNQRRVVPLPTNSCRAACSLSPPTFRTSEVRWYCRRARSVSRSSPSNRGGF